MATQRTNPSQTPSTCPCFCTVREEWHYPLLGLCRGLPDGLIMIPTLEEYRTRCSSAGYTTCPIYRSRMGADDLDVWWKAEQRQWALCA